jgi:hypothetical protein
MDLDVGPQSRYMNLGDWITWFTYAVFDGQTLRLMKRMRRSLSRDEGTTGAGLNTCTRRSTHAQAGSL